VDASAQSASTSAETRSPCPPLLERAKRAIGEWTFDEPAFIEVDKSLVGIAKISYDVPYDVGEEEIRIDATGSPRVLIKSEQGDLDRLITDEQLKRVRFAANGEVQYDGEDGE